MPAVIHLTCRGSQLGGCTSGTSMGENGPMLSLSENLDYQAGYAVTRTGGARRPLAFLTSTMLAGAFIGLADVFMFAAAGPFKMAHSPWAPLIGGAVFGLGLILCVFAGAELATSAMMTFIIGGAKHTITWARGAGILTFMLLGNLLGSIVLAFLVYLSGIAAEGTDAGGYLASAVLNKGSHYSSVELFARGILCNILVCLAIWCVTRAKTEGAKIVLMAWCMAAFVACGFEHVVANMTTFALGIFHGVEGATFATAARNLLLVGAGNIVGGGLFVAAAYLLARGVEDGAAEARVELAAARAQREVQPA